MNIKQMVIDATNGLDVTLTRTEGGCEVYQDNTMIAVLDEFADPEEQFEQAKRVTGAICGWSHDRHTNALIPNATNSMIHDVWEEMKRVAGC